MTFRAGVLYGIICTLTVMGTGVVAWWITTHPKTPSSATAPTPPAKVSKVLKEDEINNIQLTAEAVKRLGIRTTPAAMRSVQRVRSYGGEVAIPAGQLIAVAAPVSGVVQAPPSGIPAVGASVVKGQQILELLPLLTPEGRTTIATAKIEAEGQVNNATTQLDAARIALDRARRLFGEKVGSRRNMDEAQAQFDLATKTLEAATARRDMLVRVSGESERGTAAPIPMTAPQDGILRSSSALNGQKVPAGAALFEVADLKVVWIRVPVYVGDVSDLNLTAAAAVSVISSNRKTTPLRAAPVNAPPSANPLTGTVDLFYSLDNRTPQCSPGQRVNVAVAMQGEAQSLTIPWSSVIFDIHGGTWVYEQLSPQLFARRRIHVRYVTDDVAVLATGPAAGTNVVTAGAAELFGTEVGFSK